jgi:hypothetical protein
MLECRSWKSFAHEVRIVSFHWLQTMLFLVQLHGHNSSFLISGHKHPLKSAIGISDEMKKKKKEKERKIWYFISGANGKYFNVVLSTAGGTSGKMKNKLWNCNAEDIALRPICLFLFFFQTDKILVLQCSQCLSSLLFRLYNTWYLSFLFLSNSLNKLLFIMRIFMLIVRTQLSRGTYVSGIRVAANVWRHSPASNCTDSYDISALYVSRYCTK